MAYKPFWALALVVVLAGAYYIYGQQQKLAFDNSTKCAEYIQQENERINEISALPANQHSVVTSPLVFYSKKINTCVSAFSITSNSDDGFNSFYIDDLLNNNSILSEGGSKNETIGGVSLAATAEEKYRAKLQELGGN